jgi:hypothetical protein
MWNKRVIAAAIGEKGVRYGNAHQMPRIFLVLVDVCKAEFCDLSSGGCVVAYRASSRSFRLLERFISYAETVREILPGLGIGIAECRAPVRYRLFRRPRFRLKAQVDISREMEEQVLARVQDSQTYRDDFRRFQFA